MRVIAALCVTAVGYTCISLMRPRLCCHARSTSINKLLIRRVDKIEKKKYSRIVTNTVSRLLWHIWAPPGECNWTISVRRRDAVCRYIYCCNLFNHVTVNVAYPWHIWTKSTRPNFTPNLYACDPGSVRFHTPSLIFPYPPFPYSLLMSSHSSPPSDPSLFASLPFLLLSLSNFPRRWWGG